MFLIIKGFIFGMLFIYFLHSLFFFFFANLMFAFVRESKLRHNKTVA